MLPPSIPTAGICSAKSRAGQGQVFEADLIFAPAGTFYNKPGFWPKQKDNFAPRLAVAYSPDTKTSIRAGAGMYFDHYGKRSSTPSIRMAPSASVPRSPIQLAYASRMHYGSNYLPSPRFTGRHTLPNHRSRRLADDQLSPTRRRTDTFAITWGLDSKMKTPYSEAFNLSVQRELPGGFMLEATYVGRLGRHLLQQLILPSRSTVDPQGGGDYLRRRHPAFEGDRCETGAILMLPSCCHSILRECLPLMANIDYDGESATQAIYSDEWAPYRYSYGATTALADIDFYCCLRMPRWLAVALLAEPVLFALCSLDASA